MLFYTPVNVVNYGALNIFACLKGIALWILQRTHPQTPASLFLIWCFDLYPRVFVKEFEKWSQLSDCIWYRLMIILWGRLGIKVETSKTNFLVLRVCSLDLSLLLWLSSYWDTRKSFLFLFVCSRHVERCCCLEVLPMGELGQYQRQWPTEERHIQQNAKRHHTTSRVSFFTWRVHQ